MCNGGGGGGLGGWRVFEKISQKIGTPPRKSKEMFRILTFPLSKREKKEKKKVTMNQGRVQPSECFYVNPGTKLAHPEV